MTAAIPRMPRIISPHQRSRFALSPVFGVGFVVGVGAAALIRPSKTCKDMDLKSLKKKFKDKRFAGGCSRDVIRQGADQLGWELDDLLSRTLEAMKQLPNQ